MAKNTAKTTTQPENEAGALEPSANEQSANAPEQEAQTVLQAENAALREENATLRAENAALQAARDEVQAALSAAQQTATPSMQPEHTHLPQIIEARSANGDEFWRGGVLFNGAWQTVYRAEVGEEAWQRIVNEPRLRIKAADEYGA